MEDVEWLVERLGEARCASCGLRYTKNAVRGVGYENDYWLVYVTCLGCGTQGIGVAMAPAKGQKVQTKPSLPPFTTDDVLDAHELLSNYRGDVHGIFAPRVPQQVR